MRLVPGALLALLAAFALLAGGLASAEAEVAIQAYALPSGGGNPHDVAGRRDGIVWYTAQRDGKLGRLDPATGKVELVPLGPGRGAPRRDHRTGRRAVDHRRRDERDRPRRPQDARGEALAAARSARLREPEHRHLRQAGPNLVHRPERDLRSPRPEERRHAGLGRAARPRAVRHHRHPGRRRLLRLARRQPYRARRRRDRRGDGHRAADQGPGRAARLVRLHAARSGSASGTPVRSAATTRARRRGKRGSCRATGRRPTRSTSTTGTRSGSASGAPTRWCASTPRRSSSRCSRATAGANVRQILGRPGEVWAPESGVDRLVVFRRK